jgi:hypothetical protein
MVLAIAALVFHLNAIPAVVETVGQVAPAPKSVATVQRASSNSIPLPTEFAASEKQTDEKLVASATSAVSGETLKPQGSGNNALSPASFSSVVKSSESLSAIRVGTTDAKVRRFTAPQATPSRRQWIALAIAEHAAATFDAISTRQAINRGAVEADPLMKPFAQSPAIYAAIQVAPVALDFAARRMQRSPNRFLHNTWWVPQSAATGMFIFSGVHNVHVANSLR